MISDDVAENSDNIAENSDNIAHWAQSPIFSPIRILSRLGILIRDFLVKTQRLPVWLSRDRSIMLFLVKT